MASSYFPPRDISKLLQALGAQTMQSLLTEFFVIAKVSNKLALEVELKALLMIPTYTVLSITFIL